ncbi:extracellular solute-binding protein [Eubacteriales bacterium OttesenSCG-928-A19]|nr:extracellular solute-binding protein [Eubacteriales bacterium OttesenSCG-928-A19]
MLKRTLALLMATLMLALVMPALAEDDGRIPLFGTGSSPEDPLFDPSLGLTLTVYQPTNWSEDAKPGNAAIEEWIEARTGLDLQWVYTAPDSFVEKMNLVFVSGEKYDAFSDGGVLRTRPLQSLYDDGLIIDLSSYLDVYAKNMTEYLGDGYDYCRSTDGALLALPKRVSNHRGDTPTIRVDWLEAAGIDGLPTTIGEWETYMQYVMDNDMNGNGDATDEIPLVPQDLNALLNCLLGIWLGEDGPNNTMNYVDADGIVRRNVNHPNYMAFLDAMRDWYGKGYIYQEFFTTTTSQIQDLITADRVGGACQWYSNIVRPFQVVEEADPTKHYSVMTNIESPVEGVTSTFSEGRTYSPVIMVSSMSEHPEVAIAYFDWMLSDPDINATVWLGFEGEQWEWADEENYIFRTLPGASDYYFKGFQAVCQWDAEGQFLYASPEDYVAIKYDEFLKQLNDESKSYVEAKDLKVPYTKIGTDLEFMNNDAETLLEESIISYIIGNITQDAMTAAIAEYNTLYGDVYSQVYTEQYTAFMNN